MVEMYAAAKESAVELASAVAGVTLIVNNLEKIKTSPNKLSILMQIIGSNNYVYSKYINTTQESFIDLIHTPFCSYFKVVTIAVIKKKQDSIVIKSNYFHIITVETLLSSPMWICQLIVEVQGMIFTQILLYIFSVQNSNGNFFKKMRAHQLELLVILQAQTAAPVHDQSAECFQISPCFRVTAVVFQNHLLELF